MPTIEQKLEQLQSAPIAQLRLQWRTLFKSDPPKAFGPDLLRHSIAYKLQESTHGGYDSSTKQRLAQLMARTTGVSVGKLTLPRRIKPGSVLIREWKGETHKVIIRDLGFEYAGTAYPSLSEIARKITGTRWNGPRFFGMRSSVSVTPADNQIARRV